MKSDLDVCQVPIRCSMTILDARITGSLGSHAMVVQPVTFHRDAFKAYRQWCRRVKNECYTDAVVRFIDELTSKGVYTFCWMCQLLTFMNHTRQTIDLYQSVDVDSAASTPIKSFGLHVTYERHSSTYEEDARLVRI